MHKIVLLALGDSSSLRSIGQRSTASVVRVVLDVVVIAVVPHVLLGLGDSVVLCNPLGVPFRRQVVEQGLGVNIVNCSGNLVLLLTRHFESYVCT